MIKEEVDMDIVKRNKQVKQILSQEFGAKNVSVKNGRGSACGWCEIKIKVIDPCPFRQKDDTCNGYCKNVCRGNNKLIKGGWGNTVRSLTDNEVSTKAEELIKDISFYTYQDDMGDEQKEYILSIEFV